MAKVTQLLQPLQQLCNSYVLLCNYEKVAFCDYSVLELCLYKLVYIKFNVKKCKKVDMGDEFYARG